MTVGYPAREFELDLLTSHRQGEPVDQLQPVIDLQQIQRLQARARQIHFESSLADYLLDVVHATRESDQIQVGVSTRGTLAFYRAAQSLALVEGRDHVVPDDIKRLAIPVLSHRIVPRGMLPGADRSATEEVISQLLKSVIVPPRNAQQHVAATETASAGPTLVHGLAAAESRAASAFAGSIDLPRQISADP